MLHVYDEMSTPHDEYYKDTGVADDLASPLPWKSRGRAQSDELSTAAPSPNSSPLFGPQQSTPPYGPDELFLPDLGSFSLPDAQDSQFSGSDAEFELAGFEDDEYTSSSTADFDLKAFDYVKDSSLAGDLSSDEEDSEEEDTESQLLALLSELASLRADTRRILQPDEFNVGLQKIPYPQLESGFLPADFMPPGTQSWQLPAAHAETGQLAYCMAPRPGNFNNSMEPLNIVIGETGVTLEVAPGIPDECWGEAERKRAAKAKEVFRRRRGRSRSPLVSMDEFEGAGAAHSRTRGRCRHR